MLTLKECQDLVNDRQGLCLSTEYINQGTSMQWKCKKIILGLLLLKILEKAHGAHFVQ
jgi:hypothetical protein